MSELILDARRRKWRSVAEKLEKLTAAEGNAQGNDVTVVERHVTGIYITVIPWDYQSYL